MTYILKDEYLSQVEYVARFSKEPLTLEQIAQIIGGIENTAETIKILFDEVKPTTKLTNDDTQEVSNQNKAPKKGKE